MQIHEILLNSMEKYADRLALVTEEGCATYRQVYSKAVGTAANLKDSGVVPGTRVLLAGGSSVDFLVGFFALQFVGAVPALLNPGYTFAEVAQAADTVAAPYVLAGPGEAAKLREGLPTLTVLDISQEQKASFGFEPFAGRNDANGVIRFTSGTTGKPKAVAYTHENLTWGIEDSRYIGAEKAAYLCPIALSIRFGRFCRTLGAGATVYAFNSFSAQKVAAWSSNRHLQRVWASPVMLKKIVDEVDDREVFRYVSGFSSVGSYLPPTLQQAFQEKFGINVYQYYGQKECISLTEMPDTAPPRTESVGKALPGSRFRIDTPDESGCGEILYQSVRSAPGYLENGAFVPRIPRGDGWYGTGDIGWIDADGYLYVRGRSSRFINVGGLKVSPGEIEEVLYQYPGIRAAKVVKASNFLLGEVPVAYVAISGAGAEDKIAVRDFCRERLAKYKVPRRIILVDEIPMNAAGKAE